MRPLSTQHLDGLGFCAVAPDHVSLPDIDLRGWNLGHDLFWQTQDLREHPGIQSAHPVAEAECSVLAIQSIVESENGVARIGAQVLNRMSVTPRKVPEVPRRIVGHFRLA